ncbi:predicted protein [Lichtheimia corymbifera JMRC:FSU:9682]|uniref:Uncharacterized protein n=1 Tax=Lichtheimia corymbifera JMRC:FSU:9682 TaxID=1263082 RepID=A0A068RWK9_9FUNG|nr:predicted protein [Lichtheimia corymbifera JMRC:FSU:9682]
MVCLREYTCLPLQFPPVNPLALPNKSHLLVSLDSGQFISAPWTLLPVCVSSSAERPCNTPTRGGQPVYEEWPTSLLPSYQDLLGFMDAMETGL